MTISDTLLDNLLKGCNRPKELLGDGGIMKELKVGLMEWMLSAELSSHLGHEHGSKPSEAQGNRRWAFHLSGQACKLLHPRRQQW